MPLPSSMDATWLNGAVQFNAQELRRADAALFGGDGSALGVRGGIVRHGDTSLDVSVSGGDVVTVQPGAVVIPGNSGVGNGCYRSALGAAETGNLAARNATNPRIDLLVFRVLDDDVVGTHDAYTGRIELIAGVPAASPAVPALPALAVELARITVPASSGGAATVDKSFRQFASAAGAALVVTTEARLPASAPKWQRAVALDTGTEYYWSGTAWVSLLGLKAPRGYLGQTLLPADTPAGSVGDANFCEIGPVVLGAGRYVHLTGVINWKAGAANTGLYSFIERSTDGGAFNQIAGSGAWNIGSNNSTQAPPISLSIIDSPPAGSHRWRIRTTGYLANGQTVTGAGQTHLSALDVGGA